MRIDPVPSVPALWQLSDETTGYLLVREGRSLLIDCPSGDAAAALRAAGLPAPEVVLHTHVQAEHCHEWAAFPAAVVHVPAGAAEIARRSDAYFAACRTEWPPSREWDSRGQEPYGIAGCVTERPPAQALAVAGELVPGAEFAWADVRLTVVPLPGSGKHAIGLHWAAAGVLFSGDVVRAGGLLVNFYDLERGYGISLGHQQLRASLAKVRELAPRLLCPSTGPVSDDPAGDVARLLARLDRLAALPARRAGEPGAIINFTPQREFGRYRQVAPGLYQNTNFGNIILFVDDAGRGLMVDPDFCVWESWESNCRQLHADLDLLERETGLKTIERALCTHYHGDHVQYADVLRARYGTTVWAAPDVAAVMEWPHEFPYPCTIDWYGFPFKRVRVDRRMDYDRTLDWHGTPVTPLWTPGHCGAHTSFLVVWGGVRVLCAGDVFQYGSGPIGAGLPIAYNDNAWPARGAARTYRAMQALLPELILGGHSHACRDPGGTVLRDFAEQAAACEALAADLVPAGTLQASMTPPGYDAVRAPRQ